MIFFARNQFKRGSLSENTEVRSDNWYLFNDQSVTGVINPSDFLKNPQNGQAYLLFYQRLKEVFTIGLSRDVTMSSISSLSKSMTIESQMQHEVDINKVNKTKKKNKKKKKARD